MTSRAYRIWHITGILALTAVIPGHAQTQAGEERLHIRQIIGTVKVRKPKSQKWFDARSGMALKKGMTLRTFIESRAELEYGSGDIVRIGESSVVTITRLEKEGTSTQSSVRMNAGELWANIHRLTGSRSRYIFETPTAIATIRGTRLGIKVWMRQTRVDVYDGTVLVNRSGESRQIPVTRHMRVIIKEEKEELEVVQFTPETAKDPSLDIKTADQEPMIDPFVEEPGDKGGSVPDTAGALDSSGALTMPRDTAAKIDTSQATDSADTIGGILVPADSTYAETGQKGDTAFPVDTVADTAYIAREPFVPAPLEILFPAQGAIVTETPIVVKARSAPGALAYVAGKPAVVGTDGRCSGIVSLSPGSNSIPVRVVHDTKEASALLRVQYRPELLLDVRNIMDGMKTSSSQLTLNIEVSAGAEFSVNGIAGKKTVMLHPGENAITVVATDPWGGETEKSYTVTHEPQAIFALNLVRPIDGTTLSRPIVPVTGSTTPGAQLSVNSITIPVTGTGSFSYDLHIPVEEAEYELAFIAEYKGKQLTAERTVSYTPPRLPLKLVVTSPAQNQNIRESNIRVTGLTSPGATVSVNDRAAGLAPDGTFHADIPVLEHMIGEYDIEITADDNDQELSQSIPVTIDGTSPLINTSGPIITMNPQGKRAIKTGTISVQSVDRTPEDRITLAVTMNGLTEEYNLDPGGTETFSLNEGKNQYQLQARDRAGNESNVIAGTIYYLPGPMVIDIIEPSSVPYIVHGLAPLPRNTDIPRLELEVEIDDNIGNVPETIKYCRIWGNSRDLLLEPNGDYSFSGEIELPVGTECTFTIEAEDIAGNRAIKTFHAVIYK